MDEAVAHLARQLLDSGLVGLSKREQKVILHIAQHLPVSQDLNVITKERQTFGEILADRVVGVPAP